MIHQVDILAGGEVCAKAIADIFDQGMGANSYMGCDEALYRCRVNSSVETGSQKFVILANYYL